METAPRTIAFSADSLRAGLSDLCDKGVSEVYLHDVPFSRDRRGIADLLSELEKRDLPLFVSVMADAGTVDRDIIRRAAALSCSLEIPLRGTERNGALLFDRQLYAKRCAMLNAEGAVFGFLMEWAAQEGDRAKLFRERLDFAVDQYPNHIDFPQLDETPVTKGTAVFSSRDMELCRELAFSCQTFYSEGRAVPWFKSVLEPLRIKPSSFFSDFAEWQRCDNCGIGSRFSPFATSHTEIEKMQLLFLEQKYEEKGLSMLLGAVRDIVCLNGAFSRLVAEGEECELDLSYNPDDLLSPSALSISAFCDAVPMEQCRVRVYDSGDAPDYRILGSA